ncbi:phage integrase N-terminal SAM-like domain-containing protein [Actinoplanes sp. NPDC051346]|uniref:phage integrase N-terminal SAM-like domain-containing protein n=1 Tax=Actinoplanes sp. NPDC051346 TaxID=3155048 RepID=UPI00341FFAD1
MTLLDLDRLCTDLGTGDWAGFLRDWDRSLRAANHPETTRYNYLLAVAQLARFLVYDSPDPRTAEASKSPTLVTKAHVELFQVWMIETRSASTALNKHKGLQRFFRYLVEEGELGVSPMGRVRQPKTPQKLVPIMGDDDTKKLLDSTKGKTFAALQGDPTISVRFPWRPYAV